MDNVDFKVSVSLDVTTLCESDISVLRNMYIMYCNELDQYSSVAYPEDRDYVVFYNYLNDENFTLIPIRFTDAIVNAQGKGIAGFVIIKSDTEFPNELEICEAFILPEFRRQGLMTHAIKSLVSEDVNCLTFLVYKNNSALHFWEKVLSSMGFYEELLFSIPGFYYRDLAGHQWRRKVQLL